MAEDLEAQRVYARVARAMLDLPVPLPRIGRFEVRERIGAGGMGEVYGAYDPEHRREVALKVLHRDRDAGPAASARMRREARALTDLDHPNVVRIYEVGEVDGRLFIAMERLRGLTLAQHLEHRSPLPRSRVLSILADIGRAVARAHERGILHRDLKPSNIFLTEDDPPRVKVLDFGLAKLARATTLDVSTASGAVVGTLQYMSPEQARDSTALDHRCDLWSMAIIAYECLVGQRPFDAETLPLLALALLSAPAPIPSAHAEVPPGFDAWFARATDRAPDRRPSTAAELIETLAVALDQPPPPGLCPPRGARRWRRGKAAAAGPPRRTRRWRRGGLAAAGVAVAFAAVGLARSRDEAARSRDETARPLASTPPPAEPPSPRPPAAPAPRPDPDPDPDPDPVELTLIGAPAEATVWIGDARPRRGPGPWTAPRARVPQTVRVEAPGFDPLELTLVLDRDQAHRVELTPAEPPSAPSPAPRRPRTTPRPPPRASAIDDLEF